MVVIILGALTAVATVTVAVVLLLPVAIGSPVGTPDAVNASTPATASAPTEAEAVATALQHLPDDPASLIPSERSSELNDRVGEAVPTGTTIEVFPESWAPDGLGGGIMLLTLSPPAAPAETFAAVMIEERTGWKVLSTFPVTDEVADQ